MILHMHALCLVAMNTLQFANSIGEKNCLPSASVPSGDLGLIPGLERSSGEGKGYPLQYSSLENSVDCVVHGVAKSRPWLTNLHFTLSMPSARVKCGVVTRGLAVDRTPHSF